MPDMETKKPTVAPAEQPKTSHAVHGAEPKLPDEKEVNWNAFITLTVPADPYPVRQLVPQKHEPGIGTFRVQEFNPSHHDDQPDSSIAKQLPQQPTISASHAKAREQAWAAYLHAAQTTQAKQAPMAQEMNHLRHAERDPSLKAMGFKMNEGYKGSLQDLTERQALPVRGGLQLGTLFNASGGLVLSKTDNNAIATAAKNGEQGAGTIDESALGTAKSDEDLDAALAEVAATKAGLAEATNALDAMRKDMRAADLEDQADEVRREIDSLQSGFEGGVNAIEKGLGALSALASLAESGAAGLPGLAAGIAFQILHSADLHDVRAARKKLGAIESELANVKSAALRNRLSAHTASVSRALAQSDNATAKLRSTLSSRRAAYNKSAQSDAASAGPDSAGQKKVAAIIAAIPLVEHVIGRLLGVAAVGRDVRPAYTSEAGRGYNMALQRGMEQAMELPIAIGEMEHCHVAAAEQVDVWRARLQQLNQIRNKIEGVHPGDKGAV